ncbi:PP2C family protein-serine/threonine phosphatase [Streptomyces bohaiensis]|uniref:SpoIIE family protein phosphatase n=1 Tax=Streptomyces bohaiensis TaxID=1431344 RepID=A0ABX1CA66_9ACTN|nr:GAF domain-containing SpoIIE family protein phosphatase [Streptomyces bohaiensis]NJQ16026.1 SpoIIE family protein phosphatase [Streptomyces bohaiensis]
MTTANSRIDGIDASWPARLHSLWLAAQDVENVEEMARHVYAAMLAEDDVLAVTGSRWEGDRLRYLRVATTARSTTTTTTGAGTAAGRPVPPPEPGRAAARPLVHHHDLDAGTEGFAPEGRALAEAGAHFALESRFRLGENDWASYSVGLAERPRDAAVLTAMTARLVQLSEVLVASNRRIVEAREHERRLIEDAFLAEASLQMDASLDVQETLSRVARLAVPAVAEGCAVHLFADLGGLAPVASAHVAADVQPWLADLARDDPWFADLVDRAVRSGECVVLSGEELDGAPFGPHTDGPGQPVNAVSVSPLRARGKALGTLTFIYHRGEDAVAGTRLLDNLARRAALAIDTTTAYEQRRRHVEQLQRHLLPNALPVWPSADLYAAYEVADDSLEVGGDFYDAVVDRDGRLAVVIGDVCGRGAEAAALTGLARHTLRTLLEDGVLPELALQRLNTILLDQGTTRFVTALVAVLTPDGGGACLARVAAAGHPSPLVRRKDGLVEEVRVTGLFLGVLPDTDLQPTSLRLEAGDSLVMFTDGLTEARSASGVFFEDHLPEAVRDCVVEEPETAAGLVARMSAFRATGSDDTAVLVAHVKGTAG